MTTENRMYRNRYDTPEVAINDICSVEPSARPNRWLVVLYDVDGGQFIVRDTKDHAEANAFAQRIGLMVHTWIDAAAKEVTR